MKTAYEQWASRAGVIPRETWLKKAAEAKAGVTLDS